MPNKKPTKTKQPHPKPQPQQGHAPSSSQVVRADAPPLNHLQSPNAEQGDKPQPAQNTGASQNDQDAAKPYRRIDKLNIILTLLFTAAITIFTGFSTFYSSKQWDGIKQSLEDARETREVENRAYVSVKTASLVTELKPGEPATVTIDYVNKGDTPALKAGAHVEMDFLAKRVSEPLPDNSATTMVSSGVIHTDGVVGSDLSIPPVSEEVFTQFMEGRLLLYVWGTVRYEDVFGKTHKTQFCFLRRPTGAGKLLDACPTNNTAD
jgi:hypothetical protein